MYRFYLVKFHIDPELLAGGRGFLTYWDYVVGSFNSFYATYGKKAVGIALSMCENELRFFIRIDDGILDLYECLDSLKRILIIEIFDSLGYSDCDYLEDNMYSTEGIATRVMKEVEFEYCNKVLCSIFARGTYYFKDYFMDNFLKAEEDSD